jgi:hypothetical protein
VIKVLQRCGNGDTPGVTGVLQWCYLLAEVGVDLALEVVAHLIRLPVVLQWCYTDVTE